MCSAAIAPILILDLGRHVFVLPSFCMEMNGPVLLGVPELYFGALDCAASMVIN